MTLGLCCPHCGGDNLRTTHTLRLPQAVRRRKTCRTCQTRIRTIERVDAAPESASWEPAEVFVVDFQSCRLG